MELPPVVIVAVVLWVSVPVVVKANEPVGLGGETAFNWYQRTSPPALEAWRPRVKLTVSSICQTAVWYCEKVLAGGPQA
jgi:hypothetical protein